MGDQIIWKMQRALRIKKINIPPLNGLNGIVYTEEEKSEVFVDTIKLYYTR